MDASKNNNTNSNMDEYDDKWIRPWIANFEDMTFDEFCRFCRDHPDVIEESVSGPTSMKHPSWEGSLLVSSPWTKVYGLTFVTILISLALALGLGFGFSCVYCGIVSGVSLPVVVFLLSLTILTVYMFYYGKGLNKTQMPTCVNRCGFHRNLQANQLCRAVMSCLSYRNCFDTYGYFMNNEAVVTIRQIQKLNNGNGPDSGGICWIGDSEITYWHNLPDDMKSYHPNNFNAGFGGARCIDVYHNLQEVCLDWNPQTVIVHCSGNDIDTDPNNVTAGEIRKRLEQIFHVLQKHSSIQRIGYMLSSRRPIYSDEKWDFKLRIHALMQQHIRQDPTLKHIVRVLDLRDMEHPLDHFLQVDRVHLNQKGHFHKAQALLQIMKNVWPPETNNV